MEDSYNKFHRANQREERDGARPLHAKQSVEFYTRLADMVTRITRRIERGQLRHRFTEKELRAMIRREIAWSIQSDETITALKGMPTYRKMISEFSSQVMARLEPELAAARKKDRKEIRRKPPKPSKTYGADSNFNWDAFFGG